jgi:mannose-1-phosphate guanylyltransferase/mannose-6-phosphate isomerase
MQPGDVLGNLCRYRRSDARRRIFGRRHRSRTAFAILSPGIATTTKFEAPMDRRIIPLIMCGGAGTRLWPASREVHPKQFLPLFGARSTFQDTLMRVSDATLFERPIVITNTAYRFMVLEQLAEIGLRPMCCWSRCGAIPARRSRRARRLRKYATRMRSCWRSPPITWCAIPRFCRRLPPGSGRGGSRTHRDLRRAARARGHRIRLYQPRRNHFRARSARLRSSSRSRIRQRPREYVKAGYLWNSGNFMFRASRAAR